METEKKERLTVDLNGEQKHKLRVITAMHGEKYMQNMVIRLIETCFERMNVGTISHTGVKTVPNFVPEDLKNLEA